MKITFDPTLVRGMGYYTGHNFLRSALTDIISLLQAAVVMIR